MALQLADYGQDAVSMAGGILKTVSAHESGLLHTYSVVRLFTPLLSHEQYHHTGH